MTLDEYRKEKGLTCKQLAKKLGYSAPSVCQWLNGKCKPRREAAMKIFAITHGAVTALDMGVMW